MSPVKKYLIFSTLLTLVLFPNLNIVHAEINTSTQTSTVNNQLQTLIKLLNSLLAELLEMQNAQQIEKELDQNISGPKYNALDCDRNPQGTKLSNGKLACYGIWDSGDEFGNDENTCGGLDPTYSKMKPTGCVVPAPVCATGRAEATAYLNISSQASNKHEEIARNLNTTVASVKSGLINVWEYNCTAQPLSSLESASIYKDKTIPDKIYNEAQRSAHNWSFVKNASQILIAGVYEAELPQGVQREFQESIEGEIIVDVDSADSDTLLVLSAYEPVHWKLTGRTLKNVKAVYVTGYSNQRVSGLSAGVPVTYDVYEKSKSDGFFIVYNGKGTEDDDFYELQSYLYHKTGVKPYLYFGSYSTAYIMVGLKG